MLTSTSRPRPRVALIVAPDGTAEAFPVPPEAMPYPDDRTTWEGKRWAAVRGFARNHGVRLPPESRVVFIVTGPPATQHECALCARPIELGARARLDAVLPTTFVHEACRLHEHLGEWARWQNPKQ